jgi:hypothetical protein
MNIASGQTWIQKEPRDSYGNKDFIRIKYLDPVENLYCWGYYKSEDHIGIDYGSHMYGMKAVLEDQLKHFEIYEKHL